MCEVRYPGGFRLRWRSRRNRTHKWKLHILLVGFFNVPIRVVTKVISRKADSQQDWPNQISEKSWLSCTKTRVEHRKNKERKRFRERYTCFGCENKSGVVRIFRLVFKIVQPHHLKALCESLPMMWLSIGLSWKITKIRTIPVLVSHPKQA